MAAGKTNSSDKNIGKKLDNYTHSDQCHSERGSAMSTQIQGRRIYSSFTLFDAAFVLFSMGTFLVDMVTDVWVAIHYFTSKEPTWGSLTLSFVVVPCIVMQVFSIRWHIVDDNMKGCFYWVVHFLLLGPIHRYVLVLKAGWRARKTQDPEDFDVYYYRQNDVCMLRLFESFIESAPQLLLQLYIMVFTDHTSWLTGCSASISLISLAWAIAAYTKAMRQAHQDNYKVFWPGMILQTIWRIGMVSARVIALVMFASVFQAWLILTLGIHWLTMTIWIILQKTDFCQSWWEEKLFNCICGMIYCFCFFNLKEGRSRWRMLGFYTVMFLENGALLAAWYLFKTRERWYDQFILGVVPAAFSIGLTCMLMYYRLCHPSGPIDPCAGSDHTSTDPEVRDCDEHLKSSGDPATSITRRLTLKSTRPTITIEKRRSANSSFSDNSPLKDSLDSNDQTGIGLTVSHQPGHCMEEGSNNNNIVLGKNKGGVPVEKIGNGGNKFGLGLHGCFRPQDTVLSLVIDESFQGSSHVSQILPQSSEGGQSQNVNCKGLSEKGDATVVTDSDGLPKVHSYVGDSKANINEPNINVNSESKGCGTIRDENKIFKHSNANTNPNVEERTEVDGKRYISGEASTPGPHSSNRGCKIGAQTDIEKCVLFQKPDTAGGLHVGESGDMSNTKCRTLPAKMKFKSQETLEGLEARKSRKGLSSDCQNAEKISPLPQLGVLSSRPESDTNLEDGGKASNVCADEFEVDMKAVSEGHIRINAGSGEHFKMPQNACENDAASNVRFSSKRKSSLYSIICTPPPSPGKSKISSWKSAEVIPGVISEVGSPSCDTTEQPKRDSAPRVSSKFGLSENNLTYDTDFRFSKNFDPSGSFLTRNTEAFSRLFGGREDNVAFSDKEEFSVLSASGDNREVSSLTKLHSSEGLDCSKVGQALTDQVNSVVNGRQLSTVGKAPKQGGSLQSPFLKAQGMHEDLRVGDIEGRLNQDNTALVEMGKSKISMGEDKENVTPLVDTKVKDGALKRGVAFNEKGMPRKKKTPLRDDANFKKIRQAHQSLVAIEPETVSKAVSMFTGK